MTRVGITGHLNLASETVALVDKAIRSVLSPYAEAALTGVSCIAAGSDTIFAEAVLALGGDLEVILPAADYRHRKVGPDHADRFDALIRRAARAHALAAEAARPHGCTVAG